MPSVLPISNIINVSILNTPQGFAERNVNNIALFTTEPGDFLEAYQTYISASQVAEDFGSASVTAQMANAIFAQTPNIRSGNGQLVIIPLQASVSATQGKFDTANISANLADIIATDDGYLRVTIDGTNNDISGLDFTNCVTFEDVAEILQAKLPNCIVTNISTTGLRFTSKKVGASSTIALGTFSSSGTALNGSGYFNSAGGTATGGANASGETIASAITRTQDQVFYAGIITNLEMQDAVVTSLASTVQALDKIFLHHFSSTADIAGVITTIKNASNDKTRCLLYTPSPAEANLMKAAYAGRGFSVNFNGSFTSQTMNLKSLANITPDTGITQTLYTQAKTAGADLYVSYDGVAGVLSTGGNDYFDNVYSDLAIKFATEAAGFNYLRQTNTKIPQTEQGMNGLKNAYAQVMERFIRNGVIAGGSWTSSETFGDPEIFKQNILERGYYIYSLSITQQTASEREDRKAPLVQIAIKRAGAIHSSDVIILIND